jgi:hypothetical protein
MANVTFDSLLKGQGSSGQANIASIDSEQNKSAAAPQSGSTGRGGAPAPVTTSDQQTSSGQNSSASSNGAASTAQQGAAKPSTSIKESKDVSAGTAQSANQMLGDVDATIAKYQGANGKPPANHQERTKAVAQIANGLNGAEKTAFLEKIQSQGKEFGLNFGQKSIDDKSAVSKLDAEHQAVNQQLEKEAKGSKSGIFGATQTKADSDKSGIFGTGKPKKEATPQGVASTKGMSEDVADLLTRVSQQTAEETRAMVAGWDGDGNGRTSASEVTVNNDMGVSTWGDMTKLTGTKGKDSSVDDMTKMLREKAAAYSEQTKSGAASTSAS